MKDHFLYPLFKKLRPQEAQLDERRALEPFFEMFTSIYLSPFALIALIWLVTASDFSVFQDDLIAIAGISIALLIIQSRPASVEVKLGIQTRTSLTISLGSILVWMGLFVWGPVFLVIDLLVSFILRIQATWQRSRYTDHVGWAFLNFMLQDVTNTTLANLIGISFYQALGGKIPLDSLLFIDWVLAFIAIMISALFPAVVMLPVIMQINRFTNVSNNWASLRSFSITVVRLLLVITPFSIPLTLLYTRAAPAANLFATIGLVLVNLLLFYLSQTNERSQQRTREMTQLEALGEAIIQSPPDGSTLRDLLVAHVDRMFQDPSDILEIRIYKDIDLPGFAGDGEELCLVHPSHRLPAPDSFWEDLQKTDEPYLIIHDVIPENTKAVYGDAIIDKITSAAPVENGEAPVCIGGIYLLRHKSVAKSVDSLPAVQALASQVASALYRAQMHAETLKAHRMSQELALAGSIQASFLPEEVPVVHGWAIAASLIPARQTSGDFYDFIPLGDSKLGLVIADVADKGTGAALYMALSRTLIRTYALQFPDRPAKALRMANERILADTRANQFVTVFYGVIDLLTGEMEYCSAGHNPAFLFRAADPETHESYIRTGAPMGIFDDLEWEVGRIKIHPDDVLLLYTDGVNEAQNTSEEFYDYDRLLSVAKSNLDQSADGLHAAIMDSLQSFVGAAPQFDDITLMILKREN